MNLLNPPFKSKEYYSYSGLHEISLATPSKANFERWSGSVKSAEKSEQTGKHTHYDGWYGSGIKNGIEIDRLGRDGWPKGIERVGGFAKDLSAQPPTGIRRKTRRGWSGQELDIHAVNAGRLPQSWISRRRQRATKYRSISIALDMGINADINESVLFWRGAAVMRTAEALQHAGYQVEIVAFCASDGLLVEDRSNRFTYTCIVKSFRAPIELTSLVFTTCSAGFFRWHIFRAFHSNERRVCSSLGRANFFEGAPKELERNGVLQFTGTKHIKDMKTAGAWVKKALAIVETK